MTAADSAWLRMDEPSNRMTITGVLAFESRFDFERLRGLIAERLLSYERFRQKRVEPRWGWGRPSWARDDDFDLDRHLVRASLPEPADKAALQALVSDLMERPFDPQRPLWQFHYVDNFRHGSAVVARVHHCVGDGMSLVQVLLGLADPAPAGEGWVPPIGRAGSSYESRRPARGGPLAALGLPLRIAAGSVVTLYRLLARSADPETSLRGPLGREKSCAWSGTLPLDEVKDLGTRLGATINDVLVSAVAGALRRHLLARGGAPPGHLRAVVPVNLRPAHDLKSLGNRFGMVFLALPVGVADPIERLRETKRRMDRLKSSPEALVTYALLRLVGATTARIVSFAIDLFGRKASLVLTNVPGPRQALKLGGEPVDGLMFWVPQSGKLGLGVSILSYRGSVRVGVAGDRRLMGDPESILAGYAESLEELRRAAAAIAAPAPRE